MWSTRNQLLCQLALLLFVLAPSTSWAFKISPCLRVLTYSPGTMGQEPINWYNKCHHFPEKTGLAVHEHLTSFAIDEYKGYGFITTAQARVESRRLLKQELRYRDSKKQPDWQVGNSSRYHSSSDLIYGSWWNDDPLMLLWGDGTDLFNSSVTFAGFFSDDIKARYPGGRPQCTVARDNSLEWNSHFGRLQHLHFMSDAAGNIDPTHALDETLGKALQWIEFAYSVATLETSSSNALTPADEARLHLPSIGDNFCLDDNKNTTIRTLFARVGMHDQRRTKMVPDVALGSILHILQDSFSAAHTCRITENVGTKQYAVLTDAYNYQDQVKEPHGEEHHAKLDVYPTWLGDYSRTGVHTYENDPIRVGAWLLKAVDAGTPWPQVKEHLLDTVFKKASGPRVVGVKCIGT